MKVQVGGYRDVMDLEEILHQILTTDDWDTGGKNFGERVTARLFALLVEKGVITFEELSAAVGMPIDPHHEGDE